jgi:hypothetical protein
MTPHEQQHPRRPDPDYGNRQVVPLLLGLAAIIAVGVLLLTGNG